eukprot:m.235715 g.235715  ORF g.235715 m.235715 type:complete len:70 (-) comp44887_c0_seq1:141-350(-)
MFLDSALAGAFKLSYLFFRFIFGDAVSLLDFANQFFSFAINLVNFIISQLSPFLFSLTFELFPFSFELI